MPTILDLREYPLSERSIRFLSSLEHMEPGDTLTVVNDRDPEPLLLALKPVLEKGLTFRIPEENSGIWRITILCSEAHNDDPKEVSLTTLDNVKTDSLQKYVAEVRSFWGDGNDPQLPFKVKGLLEKLLFSTNPQEAWIARLIREGPSSKELCRDKECGFIQIGHVRQKGYRTPPHDHGPCWILYGVYHGAAEITTYRRTDDGKMPGKASLEKKDFRRLAPGMVALCLSGEIHSILTPEHSVIFRFLSHDLKDLQRHRYDPKKGTIEPMA